MRTRESIPAPLRLSLSGPGAVHEATLATRTFAENAEIDEADSARLAIVVEELVANLYDHGGLSGDDAFEIELSLSDTDVSLVLIDGGIPFDPRLAEDDQEIPTRGGVAGLKLVRAWASHIDYEIADGRNRLAVRLPKN